MVVVAGEEALGPRPPGVPQDLRAPAARVARVVDAVPLGVAREGPVVEAEARARPPHDGLGEVGARLLHVELADPRQRKALCGKFPNAKAHWRLCNMKWD